MALPTPGESANTNDVRHQPHHPHQPQPDLLPQENNDEKMNPQNPPLEDAKIPGPKTQTVFIHKLYDMLEDLSLSHLIWWLPSHDSFCLYPGEEFSNVLAQYFKHTNIASFIRQLNMYGFHKVNDSFHSDEKGTPSGQTRWEFRHAANQFRKGDVELLRLIKRKLSKVMSTPKEIVNLKLLPPTLNPATSNDSDSETPDPASKQQYHRSLYQQLWKQLLAQKPHSPSLPHGHPLNPPGLVYYPMHPYPGFPHSVTMPVPVSPSSPPYPDHPIPTPLSYVSQSQLRQPSNQTALAVDQLINLKLIEMLTAITTLRASFDDLLQKYDTVCAAQQQSQDDMVQLLDILEKDELRLENLAAFRSKLVLRNPQQEKQPSVNGQTGQPQNAPNGSAEEPPSSNIVPQRYPLNPNYSLYNNGENGFRHFKLGEDGHQNRQFSVLMDPLQTKALKGPDELKSSSPLSNQKDARAPPHVQQYQPKVNQQAAPLLYQPYMRNETGQQRTVSLPILDKNMPQGFSPQQRHSTTALLNDDKRPISPGHVLPKTFTLNPMVTSVPSKAPSPAPSLPLTPFEGKSVLPSVQELDKLIKRSASGRLSDLLTEDDLKAKKLKTEGSQS